jgi:hypothetical protein
VQALSAVPCRTAIIHTAYLIGPGFGIGVTVPEYYAGPHGSLPFAHVQWCESRYRTYHRPSNTYVPRIGVRAQCSSPFWAAPW